MGIRDCEGGKGEGVVMKIISWNVRGLGGMEKRKEVRALIQDKCPDFMYSGN